MKVATLISTLFACTCASRLPVPAPFRVGAAYSLIATPDKNWVLIHEILSDGTLTYGGVTPTGGTGYHFINGQGGLFSYLFSSTAIIRSDDYLFAVNPDSNTVTMFQIDPRNPTKLKIVGSPVNSGGEYPVSVDRSPYSGHVCVLNGGAKAGVQCFTADNKRGLTPIPNTNRAIQLNQTTPPFGPDHTSSAVGFSKDGKQVIGIIKGINASTTDLGYLANWNILEDGSLSESFVKSPGGGEVFSLTDIPGTDAYLVSDPTNGYEIFDFSDGPVAKVIDGALPGQMDTCWVTYSTNAKTYFLSDRLTSSLWEIEIQKNLSHSLVHRYQFTNNSNLLDVDIAKINGKEYIYLLAAEYNVVHTLAVGAPGNSHVLQTYNFTTPTAAANITTLFPFVLGMTTYVMAPFAS